MTVFVEPADFGRTLRVYVFVDAERRYLVQHGSPSVGSSFGMEFETVEVAEGTRDVPPFIELPSTLAKEFVEAITGHVHPDHEAVAQLVKAHERAEDRVDRLIDAILAAPPPPVIVTQESPRGT